MDAAQPCTLSVKATRRFLRVSRSIEVDTSGLAASAPWEIGVPRAINACDEEAACIAEDLTQPSVRGATDGGRKQE